MITGFPHLHSQRVRGFTLFEVMIASGIFFMCMFVILDLVNQSLKAAHVLKQRGPNAGILAAELSLTNRLEEGIESGDFGELYPDYSWEREIILAGTNGFFEATFVVLRNSQIDSELKTLYFRPDSQMRQGQRR